MSKLALSVKSLFKSAHSVAEIAQPSNVDDSANWIWFSSGRNNQELRHNNDYEQDINQFHNFINESGIILS